MRFFLKKDFLLNVLLPVLAGCCVYKGFSFFHTGGFWRDHLPDGLWAYALISLILIIWDRQVNIFWCACVFLFFILFELLQHYKILPGTGDILDVITYFLFAGAALFSNSFLYSVMASREGVKNTQRIKDFFCSFCILF